MATKIKASNLGASATTAITNIVTENSVDSALVNGLIDSAFIAKSTSDLSEGSNLYYTTSRGDSDTGDYIAGNRTYGNITTTGYIAGPATFTIDPAAVGDNTGTLVVAGNLQVDGTTTTINSTTMEVDDLNITLASGAANASAANGAGITVDGASATITYDAVADAWDFNKDIDVTGTVTADGLTIDGGGSRSLFNSAHIRLSDDYNLEWGGGFNYIRGSNASNYLRFATNASEKMRIDSSGNVGIGTSSPNANLHVSSSSTNIVSAQVQNTEGTGSRVDLYSFGSSPAIQSAHRSAVYQWTGAGIDLWTRTGDLHFGTNNAERMRIDSSGKVGIGTASPTYKLSILENGNNFLQVSQAGDAVAGALFGRASSKNLRVQNSENADTEFWTNNIERMRINSSGNLIGFDSTGNSTADGSTLAQIKFNNGYNDVPRGPNKISMYSDIYGIGISNTSTDFYTGSSSGMFKFHQTTGGASPTVTERMRIDSSGNVGIGSSSPRSTLELSAASGGTDGGELTLRYTGNSGFAAMRTDNNNDLIFSVGSTSFSEDLRIKGNGAMYWGGSTFTSGGGGMQWGKNGYRDISQSTTAASQSIGFHNPNGEVGSIYTTGSSTVFATSSDYRLKENVTADWDATTRLKQLNPVRFNFISDADTTVDGFLAHEVQDIVPEAIIGTKDGMRDEEYEVTPAVEATYDEEGNVLTEAVPAVMGTRSVPDYQGIDQSKLVPLLVKTIQELEARITSLEDVVSPEKP